MRLVLLAVMSMFSMACAPPPAAAPQQDSLTLQTVVVDIAQSQMSAETGVPVEASFTLSGVDSAQDLPLGVVVIAVETENGPQTLGIVNLREPGNDSLDRSVRLDLAAALTQEQLADLSETGSVQLTFAVESPTDAPSIALEAIEARAAN